MTETVARLNAIDLLDADHREVEALFKRFEKTGPRAHRTRRQIVDELVVLLSQHAGIEETVFYPAVRERLTQRAAAAVLEGLEEHHVVKVILSELETMDPEDQRFEPRVTVLIENVRHHVEEERTELFPKVRRAFSADELVDLGAACEVARVAVPLRPHPDAPDEPPANLVASSVLAPMDIVLTGTRTAVRVAMGAAGGMVRTAGRLVGR